MAIRATYSQGVLRLIDPLDLPENTEVELLLIAPKQAGVMSDRERVRTVLRAGGLLVEHPAIPPGLTPLTEAEREALLTTLPHALNLSQAVDEDREERY